MPWRLLPLAVHLLPVYCLILVFVSAIKFFLVLFVILVVLKLLQPRIELIVPGFVAVLGDLVILESFSKEKCFSFSAVILGKQILL